LTDPLAANGPMTVTELARRVGITGEAVRYYVRTGLLHPARNATNGYRQFGPDELRRLRFIRQAQSLGFSLADIGTILQQANQNQSPCPLVRDIIQRRIEQAGQELEQLITLLDRMKRTVRRWETMPDGTPDGHAICRLIESAEPEWERDAPVRRRVSARMGLRAKKDCVSPGRRVR
jgi:DNA-binding transcriptional MerR regulator